MSIDAVSATGGACNTGVPGDASLPTTCTFNSLAPLASEMMTIMVTVLPQTTGVLHNDARVSSDTFDPDNSNDLVTEDTTVNTEADKDRALRMVEKAEKMCPISNSTTATVTLSASVDLAS